MTEKNLGKEFLPNSQEKKFYLHQKDNCLLEETSGQKETWMKNFNLEKATETGCMRNIQLQKIYIDTNDISTKLTTIQASLKND